MVAISLLPTLVGVIPSGSRPLTDCLTSPHTGGGNPITEEVNSDEEKLLPTLVGVILLSSCAFYAQYPSPHTGGGNPFGETTSGRSSNTSPHTGGGNPASPGNHV